MLDIRKIKENPDAVKAGLKAKEVDCDAIVDKILELDVQVRALKTTSEGRTAQKNKIAKENGKLFGMKKGLEKKGEDTSAVETQIAANMAASVRIDEAIASDKKLLKELDDALYQNMLALPYLCVVQDLADGDITFDHLGVPASGSLIEKFNYIFFVHRLLLKVFPKFTTVCPIVQILI